MIESTLKEGLLCRPVLVVFPKGIKRSINMYYVYTFLRDLDDKDKPGSEGKKEV